MKKNKKAENIVAVIIGVFILSIVLIGLANIFEFHAETKSDYRSEITQHILIKNIQHISQKIDHSHIPNSIPFYIEKNSASGTILSSTGSSNFINAL